MTTRSEQILALAKDHLGETGVVSEAAKKMKVMIHLDWLKNYMAKMPEYKGKWWVIWYEKSTKNSNGMQSFHSKEEAENWDKENPPQTVSGMEFDSSEVFKS